MPYGDEVMGEIVEGRFAKAYAILLGRTTYTMVQSYWSQIDDGSNTATGLNNLPKYVATSTPLAAPGRPDRRVPPADLPGRGRHRGNYPNFQIADGGVVKVIYNNQVTCAVVGDTGPVDFIGEASYAAAGQLGSWASTTTGHRRQLVRAPAPGGSKYPPPRCRRPH